MGKQIKRSLIMLLCIAMIAASCGIAAFAEDAAAVAEVIPSGATTGTTYTNIGEAFAAAYRGGYTIKLLADVTTADTYSFYFGDGDVVIDLNGHNLNFTYEDTGENVKAAILALPSKNELRITGTGTIKAKGRVLELNSSTSSVPQPKLTIDKDVTIISETEVALLLYAMDYKADIYGTVKSLSEDCGAILGYGGFKYGYGTLTIYDGATVSAKSTAIYHPQKKCTLNVKGGTITSEGVTAIEMRRGTLNVSGNPVITTGATEFSSTANGSGATTSGAAVAIAPYDAEAVKVNIAGGTYKGVKALSYENPNDVASPSVNINVTGGTFNTDITDELKKVTSNVNDIIVADNGDGTYSVGTPVAQVGDKKYTSLEAAFAAATTGSTVTLLADATVSTMINVTDGKNITLDLNNHNITSNAEDTAFKVSNGELKVTGKGNIIAEKGYVFDLAGNNQYDTWSTPIKAKLTVDSGVNVVSAYRVGIYYYGNGAEAHVYGSVTSKYWYAAIQGNGTLSEKDNRNDGGTKLYIYPGAVVMADSSNSGEYTATGIYHPQSGEVYITGGTITSEGSSAIEMRNGSLNIEGNPVITSNAKTFASAPSGSGATTDGAAVAVVPYSNRDIDVNIKGGTFKGLKALYYATPNRVTGFTVDINVTGGTFSNDITEALTNADVKSNIAEITVAKNGDGTFGVNTRNEKFEKVAFIQHIEDNKKLTFFAGINYLDYEKAGFRVTVNDVSKDIPAYTVYTEYTDSVGTKTAADNFNANYFFAANLDVEDTSIKEFTITPFAALLNGTEVLGESTTVKVAGGAE